MIKRRIGSEINRNVKSETIALILSIESDVSDRDISMLVDVTCVRVYMYGRERERNVDKCVFNICKYIKVQV